MEYAVAGWCGVQALWVALLPFWYINTMTRFADEMNRRNQQLHPGTPTPPPDLVSNTSIATAVFYIGIVLVLAIALIAIAGAIKRWTWAFYALLVLLGLEAIWQLLGTLGGLAISAAVSAAGGLSAGPPAWMLGSDLASGIVSAALFAWMLVAMFQRGPWAMTRDNAGP